MKPLRSNPVINRNVIPSAQGRSLSTASQKTMRRRQTHVYPFLFETSLFLHYFVRARARGHVGKCEILNERVTFSDLDYFLT